MKKILIVDDSNTNVVLLEAILNSRGYEIHTAYNVNEAYNMLKKDLPRTTMDSFSRSIKDLRFTDLRPKLHKLHIPVMGVYGRKDNIVSPKQGEVICEGIQNHKVEYFERSGHFPMLDEAERFHLTMLDFLTDT